MSSRAIKLELRTDDATFRTLEIAERWIEVGHDGHNRDGFTVFWQGEFVEHEFDQHGVSPVDGASLYEFLHRSGIVAPSDFVELLNECLLFLVMHGAQRQFGDHWNPDTISTELSSLINDTTHRRNQLKLTLDS